MKQSILAVLLSFAAISASAADAIENGSFESTNVAAGKYLYANTGVSATDWSFTGGTGIAANTSVWGGTSTDGSYFAFIQDRTPDGFENNGSISSISQSFSLSSAANLSFSFDLAQRVFNSGGSQTISVSLDGKLLDSFTPFDAYANNWHSFSVSANSISAGSHTLSFTGNNTNTGDSTVFLDKVALSVSAVPEPSSIAMLLAGLAMMGTIARRRLQA